MGLVRVCESLIKPHFSSGKVKSGLQKCIATRPGSIPFGRRALLTQAAFAICQRGIFFSGLVLTTAFPSLNSIRSGVSRSRCAAIIDAFSFNFLVAPRRAPVPITAERLAYEPD